MRNSGKEVRTIVGVARALRLGALTAALVTVSLVVAASASATSFEVVGHFGGVLAKPSEPGKFPEEVQLGNVSALAVNTTGAGSVAPGTVYAMDESTPGAEGQQGQQVARFGPKGTFEEAWHLDGGERCGPATAEPATPGVYTHCPTDTGGGSPGRLGIAVDQVTGNVYVLSLNYTLSVYSPDGTELISKIGERNPNETIAESPSKLHASSSSGGIAVNNSGDVYVYDEDKSFHRRVMVFKPETPGDYKHYVYAGQGSDIATGSPGAGSPLALEPVLDQAGNLYGASDSSIVQYDPAHPSAPVCTFNLPSGGITTHTVNPVTGEVFYYSYKNRKIHQLRCDGEGEFVEVSVFGVAPERGPLRAMTMDGGLNYTSGRPAGVIYGATPESFPSIGSGGEPGAGPLGYILAQAEENPPKVISESLANVTTSTATLRAEINPKGSLTHYTFQYISEAAYEENEPSDRFAGANEAPLGGADLGSGQSALSSAVALSGLAPDTAYRYRVVASSHCSPSDESKVCETPGADEAFRTFGIEAPGLSDGRAYELVSPAQKNGGEVLPAEPSLASCGAECKPGLAAERFATQVAPGGEGIAYQGSPFLFNVGASEFDEYISKRTASGWQTTSLSPPLAGDGGAGGFHAFALSSDLGSAMVYAKNAALTPEAPADFQNIYAQQTDNRFGLDPLLKQEPPNRTPAESQAFAIEYVGGSADLSRVFFSANAALTEGTPSAPEAVDGGVAKFNLYEWSGGQLRLVNVQPGNAETIPGATFGSGKQLAVASFPAADFSNAISRDGLRVFWSSENGQVYVRENAETTIEIPDHVGKFLSASTDGSKVLLSDGFLYDLETETSTDLTEGKGGFKGLSGQSNDLSSIYFVDTEVLDETPNEIGAEAQAGEPNLYAWHEGAVSFIATLLPDDNGSGLGVWNASPVQRRAEASPDGRWFAFNSKAEATGKPSIGACEYNSTTLEYNGSVACEEVFLYDSQTGKLTCASCNPVGEPPHGGSFLRLAWLAQGYLSQPRYLTDQGRLFFDSRDSLSVNDTNGKVEDVYEYEPEGIGSCAKQGGCVSLISAGHEPTDSNFFAMDEDGKNVFFTTRDQLVLKDKDDMIDLYDAREGGGFPSESETARTECQGEACQPLYSAPNDPTPGSSSFEGAGNVTEAKAKKHAKKHKKKHAKKKHARKRAAKHNRGGAK